MFQNHHVPQRIYRMHLPCCTTHRILIDSGSPIESMKNKYENIHPNRNSPSKLPSWEQTCPTFWKKTIIDSKVERDMWSFPWRVVILLGLVATAVQWCKTLPAWYGCAHRHHEARQWSCHPARSWEPRSGWFISWLVRPDQTIQNTGPIVLAKTLGKKTRNTQQRRERHNWQQFVIVLISSEKTTALLAACCIYQHQDFPKTKTESQMVVSHIDKYLSFTFGGPVRKLPHSREKKQSKRTKKRTTGSTTPVKDMVKHFAKINLIPVKCCWWKKSG